MNQYVVIFRTGRTDNWKWHRSLRMSKSSAEETCRRVQHMGYKAMIENAELSESIGLPDDGFEKDEHNAN